MIGEVSVLVLEVNVRLKRQTRLLPRIIQLVAAAGCGSTARALRSGREAGGSNPARPQY